MKNVISIYKKHQPTVNMYLKNFVTNIKGSPLKTASKILNNNKHIQLMYSVDKNLKQISPIICRRNNDNSGVGNDKSHYFQKVVLDEHNIYISNPYIHYRTGKASLSVVHYIDDTYYVFDIDIISLLEELKLIEFNSLHDRVKRAVYFLGSSTLTFVSITLIIYGITIFASDLFSEDEFDILHGSFKSIIAVTLGLAIFDLARQIFEHEVLFRSLDSDDDKQYKVLGKFLISIIIALSIETLLVVFKIALSGDTSSMLSAFYLIVGTTLMFVGLAWYYKTITKTNCNIDD